MDWTLGDGIVFILMAILFGIFLQGFNLKLAMRRFFEKKFSETTSRFDRLESKILDMEVRTFSYLKNSISELKEDVHTAEKKILMLEYKKFPEEMPKRRGRPPKQ